MTHKPRKTLPIKDLIERANAIMAKDQPAPAHRMTIFSFVQDILMDTGNYRGFNYIHWAESGCKQWRADGEPDDLAPYLGDQSKRFFYSLD